MSNVHCDKGAYIGGDWVDIEDLGDRYKHTNPCDGNCKACPRSRTRHSSQRPDGGYDVVIIGAGCIGSAIARELSKSTASVLVLEAADDVTQGATKGNSGIVHAGYDDKPGTLKSKYCWPDRELNFGFQRNGSLVIAKSEKDMETLDVLMQRGKTNGVKNCRIIGYDELRIKEPHIHEDAIGALYSPDAGTITPYEYTIALAENAVDNGVEIRIRRKVVEIIQNKQSKDKFSSPNISETTKETEKWPARFKITVEHWEPHLTAIRLNKAKSLFYNWNLSAIVTILSVAVGVAAGGFHIYFTNYSWLFVRILSICIPILMCVFNIKFEIFFK